MLKHINTRKLVRIWFTKNPNEFLPYTNQLRMIRLREKNPQAEILLVTNNNFLLPPTKKQLKKFCTQYSLKNCNFDDLPHKFPEQLKTPLEQEVYQLAQKEITYTIEKKGGNLAAASDIARLFFIDQGYLYSDFDTRVELNSFPEWLPLHNNAAPFILRVQTVKKEAIVIGNDIVALTVKKPTVAQSTVSTIGQAIVENYKNTTFLLQEKVTLTLFSKFLNAHKNLTDIFSLRQLIADHYTVDTFVSANGAPDRSTMMKNIREKIQTHPGRVVWSEKILIDLSLSDDALLNRWCLWTKMVFLRETLLHFSGPQVWKTYIFKAHDLNKLISLSLDRALEKLFAYSLEYHDLASALYSPQCFGSSFLVNHPELEIYWDRVFQEPTNDTSWDTEINSLLIQEEPWVL